jgi:ribonuclease VapC
VIVIDTSVFVAIVLGEPDARQYADVVIEADGCSASALTIFEARTVLQRRAGDTAVARLSRLLAEARVQSLPFDEEQSLSAFEAYRRWGKGNHPAALNLGDCVAYALARSLDAPLLFKGTGFGKTDVRRPLQRVRATRSDGATSSPRT